MRWDLFLCGGDRSFLGWPWPTVTVPKPIIFLSLTPECREEWGAWRQGPWWWQGLGIEVPDSGTLAHLPASGVRFTDSVQSQGGPSSGLLPYIHWSVQSCYTVGFPVTSKEQVSGCLDVEQQRRLMSCCSVHLKWHRRKGRTTGGSFQGAIFKIREVSVGTIYLCSFFSHQGIFLPFF